MMNTKISKAGLSREQWLDLRHTGVGGSDVGAIMGFNPWAGILDIYLDKLNKLPQNEENEYMYWGNILEDIVAKEFSKRTGKKVRNSNFMFRSEEYPWMVADVDRRYWGKRWIGMQDNKCLWKKAVGWRRDPPIIYFTMPTLYGCYGV